MEPFIIDLISPHFSSLSHSHSLHISFFSAGLSVSLCTSYSFPLCWRLKLFRKPYILKLTLVSILLFRLFLQQHAEAPPFCLIGATSWIMCVDFTHSDLWLRRHPWFIYQPVRHRAQALSRLLFCRIHFLSVLIRELCWKDDHRHLCWGKNLHNLQ